MKENSSLDFQSILDIQHRIAEYEDITAYKKLFFNLFLKLKSFSFSIVKSKETAEEIVSDVFVEIWAKRKQLLEIKDLKMYIYKSVKYASLRKLHKTKKTRIIFLDDLEVEFTSPDQDAASLLVTNELKEKIEFSIEQLPPQCKIIYKLAKEDKLSYKEISELLNISVKTIDNQLSTALKKIASVLATNIKNPNTQHLK
ncbi:sigma-70 family RNA polymerase sigma factor [Parasediminibacterium paludis]|uniref:Sigma-70 family RNA polymerase sigma factor n=1 Tax=Parasediminibacterium paludis TaxID=908966 RepID=A0ABV8PY96_9BACT